MGDGEEEVGESVVVTGSWVGGEGGAVDVGHGGGWISKHIFLGTMFS